MESKTLKPHQIPGLPWEIVGTDSFEFGGHFYLVVTDFYFIYFETLPRA